VNTATKTQLVTLLAGALTALALAGSAGAATAVLEGGATVENGVVKLVSDLSDTNEVNNSSGVDFRDTGVTTFESITMLSAEYNVTDDDCAGGSPRFQLAIEGKNVFVYFGPAPNFVGCPKGWSSTGNFVGATDGRFDLSQLGGKPDATYAEALDFLRGKSVAGIKLVVDSGWKTDVFADKEQTVLARNVRINASTFFVPTQEGAAKSPAQACRAERTAMGEAAFREKYGTNRNKANAFGKCVSAKAKSRR
jgi:hypothetical protein